MVSVSMGAISSENTEEQVYLTMTTFVGLVQIYRMYCLMWKQKETLGLTFLTGHHITNDDEVFARCKTKMNIVAFLAKFYNRILLGSFPLILFIPLLSTERNLIFKIAFPLDHENSQAAFWITHVFVTFGYFLSAKCCCHMYIVWYLMLNLILKYDILGNKFKHLGDDVETEETKLRRKITLAERNGLYLKQFVEATKDHQKIYEYTEFT